MSGQEGSDGFIFNSPLGAGNVDTIAGYVAAQDTIYLARSMFGALTAGAFLHPSAFVTGSTATVDSHRIIYNSGTGALSYDADGVGGAAAVQFATLTVGLAMASTEFWIL